MPLRDDGPTDTRHAREIDLSTVIHAPVDRILHAFFDREALARWWRATQSVTTSRPLGAYAIEWPPTRESDSVLGRLGGVFRGTVMQFDANHGFFVADAYWLPPDGDPIGPMALEVTCWPDRARAAMSHVHVSQTGFEESPRWGRYYSRMSVEWALALAHLKSLLEPVQG